jgi:MFS family permease
VVPEEEPASLVLAFAADMYWDRDDVWVRLADDKHGADITAVAGLYVEETRKRHDYVLTKTDFGNPAGALLGIISAAYNLGAICALPFVPWLNDTFGRRWAIFSGSWIMVTGALIQAFSINGTYFPSS